MFEARTDPKRFIAGATCPDCAAVDSIRVWQENGLWQRECVRCGHYGRLDNQQPPAPASETLAQPVKFVSLSD